MRHAMITLFLVLGGCAPVVGTIAAVDFASLNSTDKTLVDHAVSGATGDDCSLISLTQTGTYCPERVRVDRSELYCYRSLADIDCHPVPEPYRTHRNTVGSPPPVRVPYKDKPWFDDAAGAAKLEPVVVE